ncbi:hypothetical protein C5Y96_21635 [Blastopirellula marina]|uniref:Uncharacterized protein n=1 Tax=Blastopirellula marina TaxID=124 RepID=A0A2S8F1J9_9BACT|nr:MULTISPECIES: hypothetical protein [Pirellulaceae]PQO26055.1 hypothetical protein C5Y96_21635 [Blastopirellula marina]RCS44413.1 hypothetical protein DTL36_21680 [Bremerella cremea]
MHFHDDPQPLISQLDTAWNDYQSHFDAKVEQALGTIVTWRSATDDMFPSHPLFGQADTTPVAEPWRPFTRHWLKEDAPSPQDSQAWLHGFDESGRIILSRNHVWGYLSIWGSGYCDRLRIHESKEEKGRLIWRLPRQDRVEFSRYWYDENGRIQCLACYLRENETHFRELEWFDFADGRCVESIQQGYQIMTELPWYQKDKPESELRQNYRPLQGDALTNNLIETMYSRRRVEYSYSPDGELVKAEEFKPDGKAVDELRFHKLPSRPIEETIAELVQTTANTIFKSVKKRATAKPYRGLILVYSAEHAHCGLPHDVSVLGHDHPWPEDRYYYEEYANDLGVEFKRPITKLLTEYNQRLSARFTFDDLDEETALTVSVLRQIAEQLYSDLAGTKHVTEDFAVLAIDDHGDVDGFEVS